MWSKVAFTLGGLFLMFVIAMAVGLGVWAYGLNTQLAQTRAELEAVKTSHEKLTSDYGNVSSESAKTTADLALAQAQIESLEGQLDDAQAENKSLEAKLNTVQAKISILFSWEFGSEESFEKKVNASGDAELKTLWANLKKSQNEENMWKLQDYIVQSIADAMGVSSFPNLVVDG